MYGGDTDHPRLRGKADRIEILVGVMGMTESLRAYILGLGADLAGFADLAALPADLRCDLPYGIAMGIAIDPTVIPLIPAQATMEYFDEYQGINERLDEIVLTIENRLLNQGYAAVAQTVDYVKRQRAQNEPRPDSRALMPHKTIATLSGLGWIGKNSLLITERYGSAVRISSVLTDAPLAVSNAKYRCLCGPCRVCGEACPGHAIRGRVWTADTDRDELIDFSACRETVKKRGESLGIDHGACGICMAVCPHTQRYVRSCEGSK